jgi:uncharacterized protein
MTTAKITALGRAMVPAEPDEMQIELRLTFLAPTAEEAVAEVAKHGRSLTGIFDELGIDKKFRTTSGVSVREEREYEKEKYRHKGYRADSRIVVRLGDAELASRLIGAATSRVEAQVDGPYWRVALGNPAREEACRQAAADAKRKAEAYAQALGVRLGALLRVGEPRPVRYPSGEMLTVARSSMAEPDIGIEAGEMDIGATVEITFAIEQG